MKAFPSTDPSVGESFEPRLDSVGFQEQTAKHSEEEHSVCALCGELFRLVEDLEKHLKWHIQGRFVKEDLGTSRLRCHEKKHSEVNQSACALFDQPFRLLEDLVKHLKCHIQAEVTVIVIFVSPHD
ncbi:unnamed protein product, partial [Cyprideis torosa]